MAKGKGSSSTSKMVKNEVKRQLARTVELKHETRVSGAFDYIGAVSGTFTPLTDINQGTADNQRVGNSIKVKKVHISKVIRLAPNNTEGACAVRVMLVRARGAALVAGDMPSYYSAADLNKMYVLADKFINVGSSLFTNVNYYAGGAGKRIQITKRFKNGLNVHYDDGTATPTQNGLWLYMIAETANAEQAGYEQSYYTDA